MTKRALLSGLVKNPLLSTIVLVLAAASLALALFFTDPRNIKYFFNRDWDLEATSQIFGVRRGMDIEEALRVLDRNEFSISSRGPPWEVEGTICEGETKYTLRDRSWRSGLVFLTECDGAVREMGIAYPVVIF